MQTFEVRQVSNGIVLKHDEEEIVFQRGPDESEVDNFVAFLRYLEQEFGPAEQSRYAKERIHINVMPGDKSEEYTKLKQCPLCWRDLDQSE